MFRKSLPKQKKKEEDAVESRKIERVTLKAFQEYLKKHTDEDEVRLRRTKDKLRQNAQGQCDQEKAKIKCKNEQAKRKLEVALKDSVTFSDSLKLAEDNLKIIED